jgi:adenylate cyclase
VSEQTFLFADLAGFTALTEAHGDEEAADLAEDFCGCVRTLLEAHGAAEVKTIGDSSMLHCPDPGDAVELGLHIVEEVAEKPRFPVVRVGMHTGAATRRNRDWFGSAVNLAARVSAAAAGNEVLLTERTYEDARDLLDVEFVRWGDRRFKNIRDPVRLYRAVRAGRESDGRPIDPVCRMAIDPAQVAGTLTYDDATYHFCSLECASAFSEKPDAYVA